MKVYNPKTMREWTEFNSKKEKGEGEVVWTTHEGVSLYVSEMETNHLFNAFRMLYNHGVPPAFRVGRFNRRSGIYRWNRDYKAKLFTAFKDELEKRKDELSSEQEEELEDIGQNSRAISILLQQEDPSNPMVGRPYDLD